MCVFYCNICSVKKSLVFLYQTPTIVNLFAKFKKIWWLGAHQNSADFDSALIIAVQNHQIFANTLANSAKIANFLKFSRLCGIKWQKRANVENLMTKYLERDSVKRCWTTIVFFRNFIMFMLCFFGRLINFWCQTKNVIDFDLCVQLVKKNINNLFLFVLF